MSGTNAVQCSACGGWTGDTSPFCGNCGQAILAPVDPAMDTGTDHTLYAGAAFAEPSGPVVFAAPATSTPGAGLKIAAGIVAMLVLVAGAALVTVLVRGGPQSPTTTIAAAPPESTSTTTAAPTTTAATTVITIAASSPTTAAPSSGNDLGAAHATQIAAIERFYEAIISSDWGYAGTHFVNAENRGPNESAAWWDSQYGTIDEYWMAPVRVTDGTYWIGLVTHETGAEGRYSYQFCIPFAVEADDFVRQTDQAVPRLTAKTEGVWIDPAPAIASLMSC